MTPPISYAELMQRTGIDFHLPLENAHTSANSPKIKLPEKEESPSIPKVGGWYPVFFDGFSTDKVNDILAKIKAGSIASIEIQYDQNATLAKQLASQIESQAAFPVKLTQSSPTDSTSVQYERKRVVAIIHTQ
jgi:endonuclease G